jgi:hypothetical protein
MWNYEERIHCYKSNSVVEVVATDSLPFEPAGTNTVTVIR